MEQVEQPVGRILSHLGRNILHLLNLKLSHLDIDRNYYALLLIHNRDGEITQQELSLLLDTDKVSIVRIIDYLSDAGYVKRIRNAQDRRKYSLVLTRKAKREILPIKKAMKEVTDITYKGISKSAIKSFNGTLEVIKRNLNDYKKRYE